MYMFDVSKYKELLDGRSVRWLAKELCYGECGTISDRGGSRVRIPM